MTSSSSRFVDGDTVEAMPKLDFFFDPGCPWTWITSRWVTEVAPHRELDVTWRSFSLTLKNEGQDLPADLPDALRERILAIRPLSLRALRVMEAGPSAAW